MGKVAWLSKKMGKMILLVGCQGACRSDEKRELKPAFGSPPSSSGGEEGPGVNKVPRKTELRGLSVL